MRALIVADSARSNSGFAAALFRVLDKARVRFKHADTLQDAEERIQDETFGLAFIDAHSLDNDPQSIADLLPGWPKIVFYFPEQKEKLAALEGVENLVLMTRPFKDAELKMQLETYIKPLRDEQTVVQGDLTFNAFNHTLTYGPGTLLIQDLHEAVLLKALFTQQGRPVIMSALSSHIENAQVCAVGLDTHMQLFRSIDRRLKSAFRGAVEIKQMVEHPDTPGGLEERVARMLDPYVQLIVQPLPQPKVQVA